MRRRGARVGSLSLPILGRMDDPGLPRPHDGDAETVRLQAEEHPLIEDVPPKTPAEHCLRLMHLRAYDQAVKHASGRDVLDVGCNTGYGTIRFAPVAGRVVGVDVSPRAIEAARDRATDGRPEFIQTSGFDLPFPAETFDLVTSFQVLEHVPDATAFLRELARVVRPGGTVILATPNAATRLYPGMTPWNRFHVREYRADELAELLRTVFPQVNVLGMVGARELYDTEIARVDAARQRIRRMEEAATRQEAARAAAAARAEARASAPAARRPLPMRVARAVVPGPIRAWVRSVLRSAGASAPRPNAASTPAAPVADPAPAPAPANELETFLRFTVDDLWYVETDLDRSMDLLAVCGVHSATGPAPLEATV